MMLLSKLFLLLWNFSFFTTGLSEMSGSEGGFFWSSNEGYANKTEKHLTEKILIKYIFPYRESRLYLYKLKVRESLSGI